MQKKSYFIIIVYLFYCVSTYTENGFLFSALSSVKLLISDVKIANLKQRET